MFEMVFCVHSSIQSNFSFIRCNFQFFVRKESVRASGFAFAFVLSSEFLDI